ncbi:MAG TPA: S41 family peptidase [Polyangiaceae bacterium]|nr:S41 family peptidase [Polyangiaceae bacterium]
MSDLEGSSRAADVMGAEGELSERKARLDGFWRSDGYGFSMEIRGDAMQLWQVTEASCALSYTGRRYELPPNEDGVGFLLDMGVELTIRAGGSPNQRKMRTEGAITDWGLERVASLPSSCNAVIPADPFSVFDSLWATYSENYPFNADKGVDWDKARAEYRPQVHADTSPAQLFDILSSMIRPLHDMHTHLVATDIGLGYDGWRPDTEPYTSALLDRFNQIVEERDVGGPLRTWAGGSVAFADLPGHLGYLRISAFDFDTQDARGDAIELDRALDEIFTTERVASQRGIIIDVRVSVGGHSPLGVQVASRLTRQPYVAYGVEARRPEPGQYTDREPAFVVPHRGPVYAGPVVLLTSRYTVSAHETFTQALLGRSPEVIRVGENTQGAISDHMYRSLPNGWIFSLPTQRFFTRGAAYDGPGVPPTVRVPVLTPEELDRGEDAAFDRAVTLLTTHRPH